MKLKIGKTTVQVEPDDVIVAVFDNPPSHHVMTAEKLRFLFKGNGEVSTINGWTKRVIDHGDGRRETIHGPAAVKA